MVSRTSAFFIVFGNDIIMASFLVTWFSNLHILWNLPKAISLQSFSSVDCLAQVLQRDYKNTMMTSFHNFGIQHFNILWNWLQAINLPSFKSLSYLSQILQKFL